MQTQTKGELICELKGKTITTSVRDISPSGVKLELNDVGQVSGRYDASHVETTTVWINTDGTQRWEGKSIETTKDGDFIAVLGGGTAKNTGPTSVSWNGELNFMTQSKKLAWLNNTKAWVEGTADTAKGEFHGKVYAKK